MAGRERGVIRLILRNFIDSFKPRTMKSQLIGEDFYGTKYYEQAYTSLSHKKRPARYFVPVNEEDHAQELPAEWEAWLRYRRKEPPTQEEVEANYRIAMRKKENALQQEATFSIEETRKLALPKEKHGHESFPKYKEYENYGQGYKLKTP